MTNEQIVVAGYIALLPLALVIALVVIECKRAIHARWRRYVQDLEKERCDLAHAPVFCGRQRE